MTKLGDWVALHQPGGIDPDQGRTLTGWVTDHQ